MSVAERTRRERLYIRGDEHFSALRADKKTSLRHSFRSRACKMIFGGIDVFHTGNIPRFSENSNCFRKNFPELPLPRACADSPERRHPILQAPQAFLLRTSADKPLSSSGLTCLFNKKNRLWTTLFCCRQSANTVTSAVEAEAASDDAEAASNAAGAASDAAGAASDAAEAASDAAGAASGAAGAVAAVRDAELKRSAKLQPNSQCRRPKQRLCRHDV